MSTSDQTRSGNVPPKIRGSDWVSVEDCIYTVFFLFNSGIYILFSFKITKRRYIYRELLKKLATFFLFAAGVYLRYEISRPKVMFLSQSAPSCERPETRDFSGKMPSINQWINRSINPSFESYAPQMVEKMPEIERRLNFFAKRGWFFDFCFFVFF